jgi:hypothetical protein
MWRSASSISCARVLIRVNAYVDEVIHPKVFEAW